MTINYGALVAFHVSVLINEQFKKSYVGSM
jgi:hypothetical protein